jgi:hypothetical protein
MMRDAVHRVAGDVLDLGSIHTLPGGGNAESRRPRPPRSSVASRVSRGFLTAFERL